MECSYPKGASIHSSYPEAQGTLWKGGKTLRVSGPGGQPGSDAAFTNPPQLWLLAQDLTSKPLAWAAAPSPQNPWLLKEGVSCTSQCQPFTHMHTGNTKWTQQALCILYLYSYTHMSLTRHVLEEEVTYLRGWCGNTGGVLGRAGCDHNALYLRIKF